MGGGGERWQNWGVWRRGEEKRGGLGSKDSEGGLEEGGGLVKWMREERGRVIVTKMRPERFRSALPGGVREDISTRSRVSFASFHF